MFKWLLWVGLSIVHPAFFFIWMGALALGSFADRELKRLDRY